MKPLTGNEEQTYGDYFNEKFTDEKVLELSEKVLNDEVDATLDELFDFFEYMNRSTGSMFYGMLLEFKKISNGIDDKKDLSDSDIAKLTLLNGITLVIEGICSLADDKIIETFNEPENFRAFLPSIPLDMIQIVSRSTGIKTIKADKIPEELMSEIADVPPKESWN